MTPKTLAAAAAAVALLGAGSADPHVSLRAVASEYNQHILAVEPVVGRDQTIDYLDRLHDDLDLLDDTDVPQGFTPAQWSAYADEVAALDESLARQAIDRTFVPMSSIRGLGETLIRSSADGTMQPVAVYVPASYAPGRPSPLAVLLHGHPQTETELIAPEYVAQLAERTGTILIAPWGRGTYDFRTSTGDVYDALDAAQKAFSVDPRRCYLVGYSMGAFSVFEVGPAQPQRWASVMAIAGGLLGHDAKRLLQRMASTPFYVLTGTDDASIPTQYPTATASFLAERGVPVSFYSLPHGTHRLITLLPILTRAWDDMHHGVVRSAPPAGLGKLALPAAPPGAMTKP